ncbi:hypothetical protein ABIA99_004612 [Bradyrhizobium sp. LB12.1]
MLLGVAAMALTDPVLHSPLGKYFDVVNIRMMATPSSALDIYNHFFASHPLTWFCQISVLKAVMSCAYQDQLSVVMQEHTGSACSTLPCSRRRVSPRSDLILRR